MSPITINDFISNDLSGIGDLFGIVLGAGVGYWLGKGWGAAAGVLGVIGADKTYSAVASYRHIEALNEYQKDQMLKEAVIGVPSLSLAMLMVGKARKDGKS
jgi:hypothetical protein